MIIDNKKKFFLGDKLYGIYKIKRGPDECFCWDYENKKKVVLPYSLVKKRSTRVYKSSQAGAILNRSRKTMTILANSGKLTHGPYIVNPDDIHTRRLFWNDKAILCAHDYFVDMQRNSNHVVKFPNKAEILASLRNNGVITYVKNNDGEFVPTWKSIDF